MHQTMRTITALLLIIAAQLVYSEDGSDDAELINNKVTDNKATSIEVAIIIDDIGYNKRRGLAALSLPGDVTYAIIPHSPNAKFLAQQAKNQKKELILHAPMSNVHNHPIGESGLTEKMDESDFHKALDKALESVPYISGVNNHMGSLLTQKRLPMEWIMQALNKRDLYFIDSRTTSQSVAWQTAQQYNVPSLKRDIFLDHERTPEFIASQFSKLITVAKRKGYAIAIAHPYPETIEYLEKNLNKLSQEGIRLVPASHLVNIHSPNRRHIHAKM
jgi:polysaccharide deacetylase 2 family uncharacterized protein YibQ